MKAAMLLAIACLLLGISIDTGRVARSLDRIATALERANP